MKALIQVGVQPRFYVSGWTTDPKWNVPVSELTQPPETWAKVHQVVADGSEFDVAPAFSWVDCSIADVDPADLYYDTADSTVKSITVHEIAQPEE